MDPTTLVTFLFRTSPEIRTVELLGSWDNFQQAYRMHHDRRRGDGFYSGCFTFDNIIFDGNDQSQKTKPRSGGLKQGGTYWYYYRLNYDIETFDDRQPRTTGCPLLPGQEVNIIEVPIEILELPSRCHSAYGDIIGTLAEYGTKQTLDPATKFATLSPPPISKVHGRCLSDDALNGRLEGRAAVTTAAAESPITTPGSTSERPRSRRSEMSIQPVLQMQTHLSGSSSSSRPHSPMNDLARHAECSQASFGEVIENSSLESFEEPCDASQRKPPAQPTFTEHFLSGRSAVLPVVQEDVLLDDDSLQPQPSIPEPNVQAVLSSYSNQRPDASEDSSSDSVDEWQIPESRPTSDWSQRLPHNPPRLYSLRNIDLQDSALSSYPSSPTSQSSIPSPWESDYPTPDYESSSFNFDQPSLPSVTLNDETIHDVSARLHALDLPSPVIPAPDLLIPTTEMPRPRRSSTLHHYHHRPRGGIWTYSLPSDATDSNHSLAKTLSAHSHVSGVRTGSNVAGSGGGDGTITTTNATTTTIMTTAASDATALSTDLPSSTSSTSLPSFIRPMESLAQPEKRVTERLDGSMADAIMRELGYLGESIA